MYLEIGPGRSPAFRVNRAYGISTCQIFFFFLLSYSGRGKKANFPVRQKRSHNFQGTVRHVVPTLKVGTSRFWTIRKSWNYATSGIHVRFSAKGWIRISTNFGLRPAAPPRVSSSTSSQQSFPALRSTEIHTLLLASHYRDVPPYITSAIYNVFENFKNFGFAPAIYNVNIRLFWSLKCNVSAISTSKQE